MALKSKKILSTEEEIKFFIGIRSRPLFELFLKMGMPAGLVNGRYWAHVDNLDSWFQHMTNVQVEPIDQEGGE